MSPAEAMQARRSAAKAVAHAHEYSKPTIAMVNGWCFGGAFVPLASCDLAIAADEATFGPPRSTGVSYRAATSRAPLRA